MLPFEDKLPFEDAEDKTSAFYSKLKDEALGIWDLGAGLLHGAVHGVVDPAMGLEAERLGLPADSVRNTFVGRDQFRPVSEAGQRNMEIAGNIINNVLLPATPLMHLNVPAPRIREAPKVAEDVSGKYDAILKAEETAKAPEGVKMLPFEEAGKPWVSPETLPYKERAIAQQQIAATGRTDLNPFEGPNMPPVMRVERTGEAYAPTMGAEVGRRNALETEQAVREAIQREENTFRQDIGEQLKPLVERQQEEAFWKARAEQLQREAQAKQAPPEVIRAQERTPFNPYPAAGTPGQMEGISRSVENLTPNQIPEGGVIPRDAMNFPGTNEPMLRVPRGNEWAVDENGIPVRQGLPESTVAPDYVNPYMRQDVPARNEMGNAIQEANGPKLGQQDTYGTEPIAIRSPGNKQLGALILGPKTPKPNTVIEPRSAETLAAKAELAAKAAALKLKDTQYDRVTTLEEARQGIESSKDMTKMGANSLRSGSEGALRTNIKNKPLNFVRTAFQEARNFAEVMSKQYITNKKDGIIHQWKKLSEAEQDGLMDMLRALDRAEKPLTPERMDAFGMSPAQRAIAEKIQQALEHRYANIVKTLGEQGLQPFEARKGYFPSMFSGAYTHLIGYTENGKWRTTGIAQADTAFGLKQALAKYKEMGKEYGESIELPRKGFNSYVGHNRTYNGFVDLVDQLARMDPRFADAKRIVDQHIADQTASLYRFDVHELKKAGVKGSLGDRPWLSRRENTKQMFEGLVDYLEQGFRYDSLQKPINEVSQLVADPKMQKDMPNTAKFIQKYMDHVTGQDLNPVGAAANWVLDEGFAKIGIGPKYPKMVVNAAMQASTSLMMGFFNMGFAAMQLAQLPQAMLMEGTRFRQVAGLDHVALANSSVSTVFNSALMAVGLDKYVPQHLQDAFKWAKERGMFDYSEAELVHNLHKSTPRIVAEKVINSSISVPEKITRPPMFMFMADLMHKAGIRGEEALLRAQAATDYAMANYTHDERPGIYQSLGYAGQSIGALSTFKHNLMEQTTSNLVNIKHGQWEAPVVGTIALGLGLYGVAGLPFYQEADNLTKKITGKSIREFMLDDPVKPNAAMDGLASVASGTDIQTRVGISSMLPDSPLQAAAHWSNMGGIFMAAIQAGLDQDEQSLRELMYKGMPASVRNVYEGESLTDNKGIVRDIKGNVKTEQPRTQEQTRVREALGLRPLQERLQADTLWTQKQRKFDQDKKLKETADKLSIALRLGQDTKPLIDKYIELGGDPSALEALIQQTAKEMNKTPKQRLEGEPGDSLSSVRRYNAYNP